jgi:glycerol-3-phosphate acyltransferase PlsX
MRIALDAMGGDYAPRNTIAGAVMALKEYPKIRKLFLTGDQAAVRRELQEHGCSDPRIEVIHTTQVVEMNEHAVDAIRRKKDSSMSRAIDLAILGQWSQARRSSSAR